MPSFPFVSVLMPVRNEEAFIERGLEAVLAQDYPSERMEVIVADGQSTDATREIIRSFQKDHKNLILIDNPGRIVSTGVNLALREARGSVLLLVGGHCKIDRDYVSRCVARLEDVACDCVGGVLETVGETLSAEAIAAAMSSRFGVGGSPFRVATRQAGYADTAVFAAYKRDIVERTGEFDVELVRNQDDEYNYRLRKLGGRIFVTPEIHSVYYSRASLGKLWSQYWQYGFWKVRVLQKHPRQMQLRQFIPPLLVFTFLVLAATAPVSRVSQSLLFALSAIYLGGNFIAAIVTARRTKWRMLPLISAAFAILHFSYGSGFLVGLVRFWNRWDLFGRARVVQPSHDAAAL